MATNRLTSGALDFITGKGTERFFQKRIDQINSMKQSALAAVSNQIHSNFARQAQTLQDTHRRYGITGAVAEAQLNDLSLRKNQQLSELQAKTSIEFDKQFESEMTSLNAMKARSLESERTAMINSLANNSFADVNSFRDMLTTKGMTDNINDEDINSMWENRADIKNIIKGNFL